FPGDGDQQPPAAQPTPPDDSGSGDGSTNGGTPPSTGSDSGSSGVVGIGNDGTGLDINAGDANGDGSGLGSVQSDANGGVAAAAGPRGDLGARPRGTTAASLLDIGPAACRTPAIATMPAARDTTKPPRGYRGGSSSRER